MSLSLSTRPVPAHRYGVFETNPVDPNYHADVTAHLADRVRWDDPGLKTVIRFRLIGDLDYPMLDVSYCHGRMKDGRYVSVVLPFSQLPKRQWKSALVNFARRDGVYAKGLGILDNSSVLI